MFYKPDIDKTIERMTAYWQREIVDRCCVAALVMPPMLSPDELGVSCYDYYFNIEVLLKRHEDNIEKTWFGGDAMPSIFPNFGVGAHSLYFGGGIDCRPDTIWFQPFMEDWAGLPEFNPDSCWLKLHYELVEAFSAAAKGRYFTALPDNVGILDALVNMRGPRELLCDLIDYPEEVKLMLKKIWLAYKETTSRFFELANANNMGGTIHYWMYLWAPGTLHQIQSDFSVMISPKMYEEFVLPELEEISAWLDYSVYHLDGQEQIKHLDHILSVRDIDAVQWTSVAGQPKASTFIPVLQRIQRAGKNLVLFPQPSEVETLMQNLSSKGLQLVVYLPDKESGEELVNNVTKWTHE